MERIINSDLIQFLFKNRLITKHQHGYLKRHSTDSNLLETLNDWTSIGLRKKHVIDVVQKAFEKKAFNIIVRYKFTLTHLLTYLVEGKSLGIARSEQCHQQYTGYIRRPHRWIQRYRQ